MEICYIEAGVLERMLARAENLSARVDRLYERNRLQRKFYYKPGDVEKLMVYVGIRRKEKEVRERRKNGNL